MFSVAESVVGSLIEKGVEALANASIPKELMLVTDRSKDGYLSVLPKNNPNANETQVEINKETNCLVAIVGDFSGAGSAPEVYLNTNLSQRKITGAASPEMQISNMSEFKKLSFKPVFYIEAERVVSMDRTAYRWEPRFVQYDEALSKHLFAGKA